MNDFNHTKGDFSGEVRKIAYENVFRSIDLTRRFPQNIFRPGWDDFLFFASDVMFSPEFVRTARSLIKVEGSECFCIVNLDDLVLGKKRPEESSFFIDSTISEEEYLSFLRRLPDGWLYSPNNFACASEGDRWSMYCERQSEMAVVAFRGLENSLLIRTAALLLEAAPIEEAVERRIGWSFTPVAESRGGLTPEWRDQLLEEYSAGRT